MTTGGLFFIAIMIIACVINFFRIMTNFEDKDDHLAESFTMGFLAGIGMVVFFMLLNWYDKPEISDKNAGPQPVNVCKDETTLQIIYLDSIPADTLMVIKKPSTEAK